MKSLVPCDWLIVGYDGTKQIFRARVPESQMTYSQVKACLARLVAMHSLTDSEIVNASMRSGSRGRSAALDVTRDKGSLRPSFLAGENPRFTATLMPSADLDLR
jgi:hypothetical protein